MFAGAGLFVAGLMRGHATSPQVAGMASASATVPGSAEASSVATDVATDVAVASAASPAASSTPVPSPSPTAVPSPSPTAVPYSLTTPQALPTVEPAPSASVNYLSAERGALVRSWLPREMAGSPMLIVTSSGWRPKPGSSPPYEFVVELPARTSIARFGVSAEETAPSSSPDPTDTSRPSGPTAHVTFAVSTASATSGFTNAVTIPLGTVGHVEHAADAPAGTTARFVRVHIDVPVGVTFDALDSVAAYGTQDALRGAVTLGPWYRDAIDITSPWVDAKHGRLRDGLDAAEYAKLAPAPSQLWYAMRHDAYTEFARCENDRETYVLPAIDDGSHRLLGRNGATYVVAAEGDNIVNADDANSSTIFFHVNGPKTCTMAPPVGTGPHKVVVITKTAGYGATYAPPTDLKTYAGYRYVSQFTPLFDPRSLQGADTVVFAASCTIGLELMPFQSRAILDFVRAGHKLIIHDADPCSSANYVFLPYPLSLSTVGAAGASADMLELIESDPLGTDRSDPRHYIDTNAFIATRGQQLGDSDIIFSTDPHWCGHLLNTNKNGTSGFVQAYARFGRGLIIYDGLDIDNQGIKQYQQISQYELALPVNANLPCSHPVGGFLLEPPKTQHDYVPGRPQRIAVDLSAVAILAFAGDIRLSLAGPFPATLSQSDIVLKSNRTPFGLIIDVPKNARGGGHRFTVRGDDGAGHTSVAQIELVPGKTSLLERALQDTGRITLRNILFDTASAKLRPASYAVLSQIADALGRNPKWRLRIDGHTDNVGGAAYNLELSQHRAASVKTALVGDFHIDKKRLATAGYGSTRPVASNDSEPGRQLNRRVELVRI